MKNNLERICRSCFAVIGTVVGYILLVAFVIGHWNNLPDKQDFFWLFVLLMLPIILFYDKVGKNGLEKNITEDRREAARAEDEDVETSAPVKEKAVKNNVDLRKALYSIYENYRSRSNLKKDKNGNFSFNRGYKQKNYTYHVIFFDSKDDKVKLISHVNELIAQNYETTIIYVFVLNENDKKDIKLLFQPQVYNGSVMIKTRYDYDL